MDPPPPAHAPGHLDYDPHIPTRELLNKPVERTRKGPHPVATSLRGPKGLKEAFILKQILDDPPSKRR